jgi:Chaperone of endosialidase
MKLRIGCGVVGFLSLVLSMAAQTSGSPVSAPAAKSETESTAVPGEGSALPFATVAGSGTTNYIPIWTSSTALGNSKLYQTGGDVGIGTTHPGSVLDVTGRINTTAGYRIAGKNVLTLAGSVSDSNLAVGYLAFPGNSYGTLNTAIGANALNASVGGQFETAIGAYALSSDANGSNNTATGAYALFANDPSFGVGGAGNTANGNFALTNNTTGSNNTAVGYDALSSNTTGSDLTCVGVSCAASAGGLSNATAIGAHAVVGVSNALVLGGTGTYAVKVGIGTATPSSVLTIAQGAGHPVSDGWETFSSRRWKTNIQTLRGSLGKVEQLRGVSYDSKATGKHEVGVIAEEVGAVLPELVSYEENGKDARGVDYSRLTALLIEATKEQQTLIREQKEQIRAQHAQIVRLTRQVKTIQATLKADERSGSAVHTVKAEGTTVRQ